MFCTDTRLSMRILDPLYPLVLQMEKLRLEEAILQETGRQQPDLRGPHSAEHWAIHYQESQVRLSATPNQPQ